MNDDVQDGDLQDGIQDADFPMAAFEKSFSDLLPHTTLSEVEAENMKDMWRRYKKAADLEHGRMINPITGEEVDIMEQCVHLDLEVDARQYFDATDARRRSWSKQVPFDASETLGGSLGSSRNIPLSDIGETTLNSAEQLLMTQSNDSSCQLRDRTKTDVYVVEDAYKDIVASFAEQLEQGMTAWLRIGTVWHKGKIHQVNHEGENAVTYDFDPFYTLNRFIVKNCMRREIQTKQVLVIGDVAAGKTTFAKQLLTWIMKQDCPSIVPVLVRTMDLVRNKDRFTDKDKDMITQFLEMQDMKLLFSHARKQGRLLIILDGFDEAGKLEEQLTKEIHDVSVNGCFFVLTSRDMGKTFDNSSFERFRTVRVRELSVLQQRQVIKRRLPTQTSQEEFQEHLLFNPGLSEMAKNPLLLNVTLSVFQSSNPGEKRKGSKLNGGKLNRGKVYKICVDGMLGTIEAAKHLEAMALTDSFELESKEAYDDTFRQMEEQGKKKLTQDRKRILSLAINQLICRIEETEEPIGLFMAGGPGSGKGFVLDFLQEQKIIERGTKFAHLDIDHNRTFLPEWHEDKEYPKQQSTVDVTGYEAGLINQLAAIRCCQTGRSFIYDGTLRNGKWNKMFMQKLREISKGKLKLGIVHVDTSLETCKSNALARAKKIGRPTDIEYLVEAHASAAKSATSLREDDNLKLDTFAQISNIPGQAPSFSTLSRTDSYRTDEEQFTEIMKRSMNAKTHRISGDLRTFLKRLAYLVHSQSVREFRINLIKEAIDSSGCGNKFTIDHWNEIEDVVKKGRFPMLARFIENEEVIFSFAHLTFQEFLCAEYCLEESLISEEFIDSWRKLVCPDEVVQLLNRGWWQQTLQMYCDMARDPDDDNDRDS
jgi:adenylate kinase family enzyme